MPSRYLSLGTLSKNPTSSKFYSTEYILMERNILFNRYRLGFVENFMAPTRVGCDRTFVEINIIYDL